MNASTCKGGWTTRRLSSKTSLTKIVWHRDCAEVQDRLVSVEASLLGPAERVALLTKGVGASRVTLNKLMRKNLLNQAGRLTVHGRNVRNFIKKG